MGLFFQVSTAQDSTNIKGNNAAPHTESYCAMLRDGKSIVMMNNVMLNTDVILKNGTLLRPSGTILRKDGTKDTLKEGQCIDQDGVISWKNKKDGI